MKVFLDKFHFLFSKENNDIFYTRREYRLREGRHNSNHETPKGNGNVVWCHLAVGKIS